MQPQTKKKQFLSLLRTSVGEDLDMLGLSSIAVEKEAFQHAKNRITMWSSKYTPNTVKTQMLVTQISIEATLIITKTEELAKEWVQCVHLYNGILFGHEKEESADASCNMESLKDIMLLGLKYSLQELKVTLRKTQHQVWKYPLLSCWSGLYQRLL